MFREGIVYDVCTELEPVPRPGLNARKYVLEILDEHEVPFAPFKGPGVLLMHDNALPDVATDVVQYLDVVEIITLDWPPRRLYMNLIEHFWTF